MQTAAEQKPTLSHDEIAKAAWDIWQQEGCPQGRDQEYWLKAEQQLLAAKNGRNGRALNSAVKRRASHAAVRRTATRQAVV
jgi:hypothetical protein